MKRHIHLALFAWFYVLFTVFSPLHVLAEGELARDLTPHCIVSASGDPSVMTDRKVKTGWSCGNDLRQVRITCPAQKDIGGLYVKWYREPKAYQIVAKRADGSTCNTYARVASDTSFQPLNQYFPLDRDVRTVDIVPQNIDQRISELYIFGTGKLPEGLMQWQAPYEKVDLMVFSAHQDDELIFMGGTIPYYEKERQKKTSVVYMANCGRLRREEAMAGLWAMGLDHAPIFLNFEDVRFRTADQCKDKWGEPNVMNALVRTLRQYRPEVVVTHDLAGEYGHGAHQYTAAAVREAVMKSADANFDLSSAQQYGTWQPKKLYLHLYAQHGLHMDWNQPLRAYDGKTALDMARIGYGKHVSQHSYYQVEDGGKYDNANFGLAFTTVGTDVQKNDFFEHIVTVPASDPDANAAPDASIPLPSAQIPAQPEGKAAASGLPPWGWFIILLSVILLVLLALLWAYRCSLARKRRRLTRKRPTSSVRRTSQGHRR